MVPITVLLKLNNRDADSRYIKSQVVLSKDVIDKNDEGDFNDTAAKCLKSTELLIETPAAKEPSLKLATPYKEKKTPTTEWSETKTEFKDGGSLSKMEPSTPKESYETPRSNLSNCNNGNIGSPEQLHHDQNPLDTSIKEEIEEEMNFEVVMYSIFQENRHLFKKAIPNKIIR